MAVPKVKPTPREEASKQALPAATALFNSSFPGAVPSTFPGALRERTMGEAASPRTEDGGANSDPESSLYDYQLMEEAG